MNASDLALDTSVAVWILRDAQDVIAQLRGRRSLFLPLPVVAELRHGALNSPRTTESLELLERFTKRCKVLSPDLATAFLYADIRTAVQRIGKPIPENDVWIAAICMQHGLQLATADMHFRLVAGLNLHWVARTG